MKTLKSFSVILISILIALPAFGQDKSKKLSFFPTLEQREGLVYKMNGKKPFTGFSKTTYNNGNTYVSASFKDGKLHGVYTAYYLDGKKMGLTHYKNGIKKGEAKSWHKNGILASEVTFINNKKDGKVVTYYANGQKSREAFFDKGTVDSTYFQWRENGDLFYKAIYENGELVIEKYFSQDTSKVKS